MVLDIRIKKGKQKRISVRDSRKRWWNLKGQNLSRFRDKMIEEGLWQTNEGVQVMWNEMNSCIQRVAKEVLGESRGNGPSTKEIWWWNDEVQGAIRKKRCVINAYANEIMNRMSKGINWPKRKQRKQ